MGSGLAFKHSGSVVGNMSHTEPAESTENDLVMPCGRLTANKHHTIRTSTGMGSRRRSLSFGGQAEGVGAASILRVLNTAFSIGIKWGSGVGPR